MTTPLKFENENQAREVLSNLVGKKAEVWCTGVRVAGPVKTFEENDHVFVITVDHRPVTWGSDAFTTSRVSVRKSDGMWMSGISTFDN